MTTSKSIVFRFADVEVREQEFSVIKAGEVSAVEPKAFRVLIYLLRNPQRLIPKGELLNAVWGDAAVTESSLTRSILKLRRLLGDETRNPIYIETVATIGYRLVCRVEVSEEGFASVQAPAKPTGSSAEESSASPMNGIIKTAPGEQIGAAACADVKSGSRGRRLPLLIAVAVLLAACLGAAVWYLHRPLPSLSVSAYTQVTHDGRRKALVGTDGSRLFFTSYDESVQIPAEASTAGGDVAPIPVALPDPWVHDVSPGGTALLVTSSDKGRGSLWSVGVEGNSLRHLADGDIGAAAWSPDGRSVAYSTSDGDLHVIRTDGTESSVLGRVPYLAEGAVFERISWSPDGKTIRFDRNNRIYEVSLDGSAPHPFLPGWHPSSWLSCGRWTPDRKFYLFLVWDHPMHAFPLIPPLQIWALDERGSLLRRGPAEPFPLTAGPTRWGRPVPARDGKTIFARGINLNGELQHLDAQSHLLQPYLGGISAEGVSFSPDGNSLAYVTYPEGILWKANRDGSNRTQLTDSPLYPALPRWSPDGTRVLFSAADAAGHYHSYIVSSQGGAPQPILPGAEYEQADPNWSPDGRRIVFSSLEGEGETAKRVTRILDLVSHQVTALPGEYWSPRWSPQGRFLAGLTNETADLTLFDFVTGRWSVLEKGRIDFPTWSHDGRFIYFLRLSGNAGLYRILPSGGQAERIVDLKGFRHAGYFGFWMGLDPDDNLLLLRDIGGDDLYALTLEEK